MATDVTKSPLHKGISKTAKALTLEIRAPGTLVKGFKTSFSFFPYSNF